MKSHVQSRPGHDNVARVERVENGYAVLLTKEVAESLHLTEGSIVEVVPVAAAAQNRPATTGEALRAFEDTLPEHEEAYRELAK